LTIKDLKLNVRGYAEDQTYSIEPFLVKNIRRGNTLIEISEGGMIKKEVIGRKGLIKFFDLKYEFVDPRTRYNDATLDVVS